MKKLIALFVALLALAGAAQAAQPADALERPLAELLAAEAQSAGDPWVQAVFEAGAADVRLEDGAVLFRLRSFNPRLDALKEVPEGEYLAALYAHASAYDLECALAAPGEAGWDADEVKALNKAVSIAASESRTGFDAKEVRVAIAGYLLSAEGANALGIAESAENLEPLFAAQVKQSLSVSEGPHALKLVTTGAEGPALAERGYRAALQTLSRKEGDKSEMDDQLGGMLASAIAEAAADFPQKEAKAHNFIFDIDQLFDAEKPGGGKEYREYMREYVRSFNEMAAKLAIQAYTMPDYPAQDFPKSGRLSGSTSGTKVIFKNKDDYARLMQMREADTGELVVEAFARPNSSATVRVPKGSYCIQVAVGEVWYGEEHMFGDMGDYSRSEATQIKGGNYYYVFEFGGTGEGNMEVETVSASDF